MRDFQNYFFLLATFILGPCFDFDSAHAAIIEYEWELEGRINSPIFHTADYHGAQPTDTHYSFEIIVNRGDLILSQDTRGTESTADDILSISGTTKGCIGHGSSPCSWGPNGSDTPFLSYNVFGYGFGYHGVGDFSWDLQFRNPLNNGNGTSDIDDPNPLVYGAQEAGTLELLNPGDSLVPTLLPVSALNHKTEHYALRLFDLLPLGDGEFRIDTWLQLTSGLIGDGFTRFESLPGETVFNADLRAFLKGGTQPPADPPQEIPEPFTLTLLSSALLGAGLVRKSAEKN